MMRHHLSLDAMQMTYVLKYMRKLCIPSEKMQSVLDELEYFGFADADRRKDRLYDGIPDGDFPWSYKYSLFDMRAGDIDEDHYERLYTRHFMLQMSRTPDQTSSLFEINTMVDGSQSKLPPTGEQITDKKTVGSSAAAFGNETWLGGVSWRHEHCLKTDIMLRPFSEISSQAVNQLLL
ncbi:hypothetical protein IV203_025516 [Nitzschia inconspicua]|uniref:Uncharacterized protein n=1 Tax=Nitzschia inconspicua TaxID=303405 RepID=A0A9K3KAB7_9STRA|nr:hypothetical protein IV203_028294 [Nitzschia inconspicua]KAG7362632.1 hypothetical protein IV203_025516 [Nitzschia inconspicua]